MTVLKTLVAYMYNMLEDIDNLCKEKEIRHQLSFVYNIIKLYILKNKIYDNTYDAYLYSIEEIIFKYKLYNQKLFEILKHLKIKHEGKILL